MLVDIFVQVGVSIDVLLVVKEQCVVCQVDWLVYYQQFVIFLILVILGVVKDSICYCNMMGVVFQVCDQLLWKYCW